MTDTDEPCLGIWVMSEETVGSGDGVIGDFKCTSFNVDGHDLSSVIFFYLWADLFFVYLGATSGELFFAVPWL